MSYKDAMAAYSLTRKSREKLLKSDIPDELKKVLASLDFNYDENADVAAIHNDLSVTVGPKILKFDGEVLDFIVLHELMHKVKGHLETNGEYHRACLMADTALEVFTHNIAADIQVDYYLSRILGLPCPSQIHGGATQWDAILQSVDRASIQLFGKIVEPPYHVCLSLAVTAVNVFNIRPTKEYEEYFESEMQNRQFGY